MRIYVYTYKCIHVYVFCLNQVELPLRYLARSKDSVWVRRTSSQFVRSLVWLYGQLNRNSLTKTGKQANIK